MSTTLERAARAVREIDPELTICEAEEFARAVLMAVREPSEAMRVAGGECVWDEPGRWSHHVPDYEKDEAQAAWQAMIDAILNEKDTTND